ncbi:substrate-binding protein [Siccirubricoccus deserti]|uniref:ABC transporter substrate-binding protein n=1 Tax=Siccirubricoccus deserti TaxID=2013562 RepID=A0A9X0UDP6_9PROT|nr:ABC transporter substrate-binding protein [Siccirubricoccus deserti]MBC4015823.1 ABC transporter substrate-binding protein [Siccirubricoccus deserti]GGC44919.1 substrate-binding protein [Siccirubricoccus deserti]
MDRRDLLRGAAAAGTVLALPRAALAQPAAARVLRFIPQSDLGILDPIVTTAYVSRHHGFMVFDTLYGMDADFRIQPQMAGGHRIEEDGRRWTITLRPGLQFHDGEPVRAKDCIASIRRWAGRHPLGQELLARLDEMSAADDRSLVFRLKRPFPLLAEALGSLVTPCCFIMPERLAQTDPARQVPEMVGSGPFRFKADERVQGSRFVYEKFAGYLPREEGTASWTAGPKRVNLDRVEWIVTPDSSTAAAALQNGETDWWEVPTSDLLPLLRRNRNIAIDLPNPTGLVGWGRFNHLHPPFDNPRIRRALMGAVSQADYMTAVTGTDRSLWRENVGFFPPETPMASDVGLEVLKGPRDFDKVKREIEAAGYKGEKVVLLAATDFPTLNALGQVGNDMLRRAGMNVDFVATDWGSVVARRASREPPEKGGWSIFFNFWTGLDVINPGVNQPIRGNGGDGWWGWATSPRLETLRQGWFDAADLPRQQAIAREMQQLAFEEAPTLPLGQYFQSTAYRRSLADVPKGMPLFWSLKKV